MLVRLKATFFVLPTLMDFFLTASAGQAVELTPEELEAGTIFGTHFVIGCDVFFDS